MSEINFYQHLSVFVMTAAAPRESSYACYYDEKLETYLADVFSLNWMNDAETVSYSLNNCI